MKDLFDTIGDSVGPNARQGPLTKLHVVKQSEYKNASQEGTAIDSCNVR